ncbi:MAG: hypothetical protein JW808_08190, partial [Victivallales bacterium]|nr:hypothetical protein [Victivallales bacterium]
MIRHRLQIERLVRRIYDPRTSDSLILELERKIASWQGKLDLHGAGFSPDQRTSVLITYGDNVSEPGRPPLATLHDFLKYYASGIVDTVHILPFFPYSSDDGFSVIDYRRVDTKLGDWSHINDLANDFHLAFDLVLNHISSKSEWFQAYLRGEEPYRSFFIETDHASDLAKVVRPRSLPLLTEFNTSKGKKHLWTTFSADQIDLNFASHQLFLEIIDILLFYVSQGASIIRLDAIAYLWKEIGTECIHHPKTHAMVQIFRAILEQLTPQVAILTETNVPHGENISYFGDGSNEAHMVYQFT